MDSSVRASPERRPAQYLFKAKRIGWRPDMTPEERERSFSRIRRARPGSALGQAVGAMIERECMKAVRRVLPATHELWSEEHMPPAYRGTLLRVPDYTGKLWQIDGLVTNAKEPLFPVAIVDPKYIQRTKWCYDKGGWLCTVHPQLRRTFSTLRGSVALLAGRWSPASIRVIEQHRIKVLRLPYEHIQEVMNSYGVNMGWRDEDSDWAAIPAFEAFSHLPPEDLARIPPQLMAPLVNELQGEVLGLLQGRPRAIANIDLELTTNLGEYLRVEAKSLVDAKRLLDGLDLDEVLDRKACYFDVPTKTAKRRPEGA